MKTLDVDKFLEENAVEIIVNGKTLVVKDIDMTYTQELAKEDSDKKAILAKVLKCDVKDLDSYGAIGLMKIIAFLNENLAPKVSL